jgi:thymidine kinase
MNSGKSTALLQAAHNYEERDQAVLLAKPAVDTKGNSTIVSRLGVSREIDFLVTPKQNLRTLFAEHRANSIANGGRDIACLLIDE